MLVGLRRRLALGLSTVIVSLSMLVAGVVALNRHLYSDDEPGFRQTSRSVAATSSDGRFEVVTTVHRGDGDADFWYEEYHVESRQGLWSRRSDFLAVLDHPLDNPGPRIDTVRFAAGRASNCPRRTVDNGRSRSTRTPCRSRTGCTPATSAAPSAGGRYRSSDRQRAIAGASCQSFASRVPTTPAVSSSMRSRVAMVFAADSVQWSRMPKRSLVDAGEDVAVAQGPAGGGGGGQAVGVGWSALVHSGR